VSVRPVQAASEEGTTVAVRQAILGGAIPGNGQQHNTVKQN